MSLPVIECFLLVSVEAPNRFLPRWEVETGVNITELWSSGAGDNGAAGALVAAGHSIVCPVLHPRAQCQHCSSAKQT